MLSENISFLSKFLQNVLIADHILETFNQSEHILF
jgi:hypothetical protein